MNALTPRQLVARATVLGFAVGVGIISVFVIRAAYTVSVGGRWYQVRELAGYSRKG